MKRITGDILFELAEQVDREQEPVESWLARENIDPDEYRSYVRGTVAGIQNRVDVSAIPPAIQAGAFYSMGFQIGYELARRERNGRTDDDSSSTDN